MTSTETYVVLRTANLNDKEIFVPNDSRYPSQEDLGEWVPDSAVALAQGEEGYCGLKWNDEVVEISQLKIQIRITTAGEVLSISDPEKTIQLNAYLNEFLTTRKEGVWHEYILKDLRLYVTANDDGFAAIGLICPDTEPYYTLANMTSDNKCILAKDMFIIYGGIDTDWADFEGEEFDYWCQWRYQTLVSKFMEDTGIALLVGKVSV